MIAQKKCTIISLNCSETEFDRYLGLMDGSIRAYGTDCSLVVGGDKVSSAAHRRYK
jgi:hypothetical protein